MTENINYLKKLVKKRLATLPPDVSFSIGNFGDFSRDELIHEVDDYSEVGKVAIDMQVEFIKRMPKLLARSIK